MKFLKKPIVIEAIQWTGENNEEVKKFYENKKIGRWLGSERHNNVAVKFFIKTLEGEMCLIRNDWLIKGVKGEFYPCKPGIFAETYEPVEPEEKKC